MRKAAVITGGHHYEVQPFHALFRALPGIDAYVQHMEDFVTSPQEVRDGYDALIFYIMPTGAPEEQSPCYPGSPRRVLERLGETRQGIVLLHHAVLAYPDWPAWDALTGMRGRVITEYAHDAPIPVHIAAPDHPITRGIAPWTIIDETYVMGGPDPDSTPLLTTNHPACIPVLAWTRAYRSARVFCYQSGHGHTAFEDENFRRVLANGIHWTAGAN